MITTFLVCLIMSGLQCETAHPDLGALIPKDLLSNDDHNAYAQTPELKCLVKNDGNLAIIQVTISLALGHVDFCYGHQDTIAWFGQHGYKIVEASDLEVYMQR